MAITRKNLAFGQVPSTKGAIYTVPGSTKGAISNAIWFNAHTSAVTIKIYVDAGTEYQVWEKSLASKERIHVPYPDVGMLLEATTVMRAEASVDAVVTYKLDGREEA